MSDPARLLYGNGGSTDEASDFEKELLGSWDAEQPSDASRAKVLALVGVGAGAAVLGAAAKIGAGAGSMAPKAAALGTAALAKWALVGVVAVAALGAVAGYVHHERQGAAAASVARTGAASKAPPPPQPRRDAEMTLQAAPTPPSLAPERSSDDAPARSVAPPRHAPSASRAPDPTLGDEVSALDHARRAMADGDAAGALRRLDDYEARFAHGALFEEAQVLRIEALLAEGDRGAASRVAGRFLAVHPSSPHAARVRALLKQTP